MLPLLQMHVHVVRNQSWLKWKRKPETVLMSSCFAEKRIKQCFNKIRPNQLLRYPSIYYSKNVFGTFIYHLFYYNFATNAMETG